MSEELSSIPEATPSNYQRTTGGNLRWKPPTAERLQQLLVGYEIFEMLGSGGMGAVYKARQVSLDRMVAIKILPPEASDDEMNFVERFRNEARTMAKMNHPAIVGVYDFGETREGHFYIVMEFVDGTDVSQMVLSQGKLAADHALAITAHVCDALQYAHTHGVIHRDIKPANILINMEGAVKVADFGLAKASDPSQSGITQTNMTMGTPDYVAPEALIVGIPLDGRADLYAVGVMLYNMLTGSIPRGVFAMPSKTVGTDPRFDAIITKAMESDRDARYQTALEVRRDLDVILTVPMAKTDGARTKPVVSGKSSPQKPVARGPQTPQGKSGNVPARSSPVPVRGGAGGEGGGIRKDVAGPGPGYTAAKKSNRGPVIGVAATGMVVAVVLFFLFKPSPPVSKPPTTTGPSKVARTPIKVVENPPKTAPIKVVQNASSTKPAMTPIVALAPGIVRQTIDLLALTDPVQDRVLVSSIVGKNEWAREGAALVYKSDGKSGLLAAPVAFGCRDFEIELRAERRSGGESFHTDLPLGNGRILPLMFNFPGRKVINGKEGREWGQSGSVVHVTARVKRSADGLSDRIVIQRKDKNETLADWTGSMDKLAQGGPQYASFPGQPLASIYTKKDPYVVKTWTLRVFEGEAKVLRESSGGMSSSVVTFGGHRYQFVPDKTLTWTEAKAKAESMGGHLVTITSKEENDWIANSYIAKLERGLGLWIGGTSEGTPGKWSWVTGEPFTFTAWGPNEPTNAAHEPVLVFSNTVQGTLTWGDIKNSGFGNQDRRGGLLVEWDDDGKTKPAPVVVATALAGNGRRDEAGTSVPGAAPVPAMPAGVPANLKSEPPNLKSDDPRLAQLAAGFKARYEADAQKPYLAAVAALNQSYVSNGIGRARSTAQQKGALDEVTALDAEKARIQKHEALPPADLETLPASLKALRATYRAALAKIEDDRTKRAAPLYELYLGALDSYVGELTRENKIDEALKVKTLRDDIAAQKPKTDADIAAVETNSPTRMNKPGAKPAPENGEVSVSGGRSSRWFDAARWVMSVGGTVRVEKNGKQFDVRKEADIPSGKFDILIVDINGDSNPKAASINDDDFSRFSGLKELRTIFLRNIKVGDNAFAFLPTTPAVTRLEMYTVPVTDGVLTHIAPLRQLTDFIIENSRQFTGAGLERLASVPLLKRVSYNNTGISDAGAKVLAGAPNLEMLNLSSTLVTDEGIAAFGSLTKLGTLTMTSCRNVRGTTLAAWEKMSSLKSLDLSNCALSADILPIIGRFIHLKKLDLRDYTFVTDETLSALAPLTELNSLGLSRSRVTGTGFTALRGWTELRGLHLGTETPVSAEGLAAIAATFPKLEELGIGQGATLAGGADFRTLAGLKALRILTASLPTLDDAALADIAQITPLESLNVNGSGVTARGISALKPLKLLTKLLVENCKSIDDDAISSIKELKGLKDVYLKETLISSEGVSALKKALPGCKINK